MGRGLLGDPARIVCGIARGARGLGSPLGFFLCLLEFHFGQVRFLLQPLDLLYGFLEFALGRLRQRLCLSPCGFDFVEFHNVSSRRYSPPTHGWRPVALVLPAVPQAYRYLLSGSSTIFRWRRTGWERVGRSAGCGRDGENENGRNVDLRTSCSSRT